MEHVYVHVLYLYRSVFLKKLNKKKEEKKRKMAAIFTLRGMLTVLALFICTAYYLKSFWPSWVEKDSPSLWKATLWKAARVGERLSPWVALLLIGIAITNFIY